MNNYMVTCIFILILWLIDSWIFMQGYDSLFQHHKTPEEKAIQRYKIKILRIESEIAELKLRALKSQQKQD